MKVATIARSLRRRLFLQTLEDRAPPATFTVTNTGDNGGINPAPGAGTGTLRQAIIDANASSGADAIQFNIAPGGVQTIGLAAALPNITDPVFLAGYSQGGGAYNGPPLIVLDGSGAGSNVNG